MKKGFSLFTPLVGTAIVVMAIIISVTMIQNDARISKSLGRSYEITAQEINAKMIKASAEISVLKSFEEGVKIHIKDSKILTCTGGVCSKQDLIEEYKSNIHNHAINHLHTDIKSALDNVGLMGDISYGDTEMYSYLSENPNSVKIDITDDKIECTINIAGTDEAKEVFSVEYKENENTIKVSILPENFKYTYKASPIGKYLEGTANLMEYAKDTELNEDFAIKIQDLAQSNDFSSDFCFGQGKVLPTNPIEIHKAETENPEIIRYKVIGRWLTTYGVMQITVQNRGAINLPDVSASAEIKCYCEGNSFKCFDP